MMEHNKIIVRINGILPNISALGSEDKSERAAEIKRTDIIANTSCSVFVKHKTDGIAQVLVDVGEGVVRSMEKGISDLGFKSRESIIPDGILITHAHNDHVKELPILLSKVKAESSNVKVFCTKECYEEIINKFPELSTISNSTQFDMVQAGESFEIGPFSIMPVLANHDTNSPSSSVIYILTALGRKIIIGWDFLSLPNVNENLLWNPDLLILGTETYNHHPSTGMISVTEAYDIVRRWNAKECYIVHYSGLKDFEEATNQWFRGPVKPMTTDELQSVIDSHLRITGANGKFRIVVAKEGMVWTADERPYQLADENISIDKMIEIESIQKYVLKIEKEDKDDKLKLMIEDRVNRLSLEFVRPRRDKIRDILYAEPVRGMMAKGPQLKMEIIPQSQDTSLIRLNVSRGKKNVFKDDVLINNLDDKRLKRYFNENFIASTVEPEIQ
jgi:phosphoribosyl 1,2-cyclic phosphodiesterase